MTRGAAGLAMLAVLTLSSCSSPPFTLYVLAAPANGPAQPPLNGRTTVIAVARIALPDYLDTDDIVVRRGSVIEKSHQGRWASRLSLGATDLVTARLAIGRPDALITAEPQTAKPAYRLVINVSRLDVAAEGLATLDADWLIVPGDPTQAMRRDRGAFRQTGAVATDSDVVALQQNVLEQLAAAILATGLR